MKPWLRQGIWLAVALIVPVLLSLALLPLRDHVSDVLIALILLTVSAAAVARGELLLSLVAATSTALSFDYFFTVPYDQFAIRGAQGVVTTVALIAAVPALGTWIGRLLREGGGTGTGTAGKGRTVRRGAGRTAAAGRAAGRRPDRRLGQDCRGRRPCPPPDRAEPARRRPAAPGHNRADAEQYPRQGPGRCAR